MKSTSNYLCSVFWKIIFFDKSELMNSGFSKKSGKKHIKVFIFYYLFTQLKRKKFNL